MRRLTIAVLLVIFTCAAQVAQAQPDPQNPKPAPDTITQSTLIVPAGTAVELALTSPILTRTAKLSNRCSSIRAPASVRAFFVAPLPATTSFAEDFETPYWLHDSTMSCLHSKPAGQKNRRLANRSSSEGWPQNTAYG